MLQIDLYAANAAGVDFYTSLMIDGSTANRASFAHARTGEDDRGGTFAALCCSIRE